MQKLQTLGVAPVVTVASDLFLIHLLLMAFCTFVLVIVFCNISMLHLNPVPLWYNVRPLSESINIVHS